MKRVVVVADNFLIVETIRIGLRTGGEFKLLGYANGRRTSAMTIVNAAPDVVLVDDMDRAERAVSLIKEIKVADERITVLVLTGEMDPAWLDRVFDAGASGAISKAIQPVAMATLVRETLDGHVIHVGTRFGAARRRRGLEAQDVAAANCPLTTRELEILQLVAGGATNGDIAQRLWVTEQTVKFHLSNIYRKLEVGNRTQASRYAHLHGLVPDDLHEEPARLRAVAAS
jgi:DNA-binding NarL/FixJ family response regulator